MNSLLPLASLLLSTGLLLVGHGMQLTLLPLRAASIGLGNFEIGLSASFYFGGFVAGCFVVPQVIARVGHIRSFAVLTAVMASAVLLLELTHSIAAWLALRFLTGAAICGLYTVIESWLNDQASSEARGAVLAAYTFIVLLAMTVGQFLIAIAPPESSLPFSIVTLFLATAIVPVGLTRALAPAPLESTRLRLALLLGRSREAFAGGVVAGLVSGAFWGLGAVFAREVSESITEVTWFMAVVMAGGAAVQYPLAVLSGRVDRRYLLLALSVAGVAASAGVACAVGTRWLFVAAFFFGGAVLPLYATSLTIAADSSRREEFVEIGTSLLLLNASGSALSPLVLGPLMTHFGSTALFWASGAICAVFAAYLLGRALLSERKIMEREVSFTVATTATAPTGLDLDPRGPEEASGDLQPVDVAVDPAAA